MDVNFELLSFYALAAVIVVSALLVITRKNAIVSAMFLAVSLMSIGALYITLGAEFLFAVQVLVYTGGVMVLFLFVIMLVNIDELAFLRPRIRNWGMPVLLVTASFAGLLLWGSHGRLGEVAVAPVATLASNTKAVALLLFTNYLLLFELMSVLLLVAMVGAIVLLRKES